MEQTPIPPEGAALDREVFERVWRRVMPEDRPDCPFTLEPPTPENTPPAPLPLPEGDMEMAPMAQQAVPAMAVQDAGSTPPQAVQRPPAAARMEPVPPPEPCLGQASIGELPRLEELLTLITDAQRIYRALARRTGWAALSALSREKARQTKRLSTARTLVAGSAFFPPPTAAPGRASPHNALRERFRAENQLIQKLERAAEETGDPCLGQLYRALAAETRGHIRRLWELAGRL